MDNTSISNPPEQKNGNSNNSNSFNEINIATALFGLISSIVVGVLQLLKETYTGTNYVQFFQYCIPLAPMASTIIVAILLHFFRKRNYVKNRLYAYKDIELKYKKINCECDKEINDLTRKLRKEQKGEPRKRLEEKLRAISDRRSKAVFEKIEEIRALQLPPMTNLNSFPVAGEEKQQ